MEDITREEFAELKYMVKDHDKRLYESDSKLKVMDNIVIKFIESMDRLDGTMTEQGRTLMAIQMTMKDMSHSIESQGNKINSLEKSIDKIESASNINVVDWLKKNFIWLALLALYASLFAKDFFIK